MLQTAPSFKDPGLARRLTTLFAHAWSTHTAWPEMMIDRAVGLSSSGDAGVYRDELIARLTRDKCLVPQAAHTRPQRGCMRLQDDMKLWLPMSLHPWWQRIIKKAIARTNRDCSVMALLGIVNARWAKASVCVAWKNALPSADALLQR